MERQRRHTTTTWLSRSAPLVLASFLALAPADAAAQTSLQIPLQFDFLNPGAKSLAVGGAFAGLADDATATFANPAGLVQLGASEVSFELRGTWVTTPFLQAGRLSGTVTNQGDDTIAGPVFADSSGSHVGPGFIAGVYMHPSHRWVIAGYRHELARVDQTFFSNGVFQQNVGGPSLRDTAAGSRPAGQHYRLRRRRFVPDFAACRCRRRSCCVHVRHELGIPPFRHGWVFRATPAQ